MEKIINSLKPRSLPIRYGYYSFLGHVWSRCNCKDKDLREGKRLLKPDPKNIVSMKKTRFICMRKHKLRGYVVQVSFSTSKSCVWYLDSGFSKHMNGKKVVKRL